MMAYGSIGLRLVTALCGAGLLLGTSTAGAASPETDRQPQITIVAIVDHPTIDAMRRGISDSLRAGNLTPGAQVRIRFENAQADLARVEAIARSLGDSEVDLVIALSEPVAQVIAAQPLRIPVIVSGIALDAADKIATNRRARLLTGVAIGGVRRVHLDLIATIRPDATTVLVPYLREDAEQAAMVRTLMAAARTKSLSIKAWQVPAGAKASATLPHTTLPQITLPPALDTARTVLYLAAGATRDSADALIAEAGRLGMPIIADSRDLVVRGATATIVHDYYAIGRQTGRIVAAILRDTSLARRPITRANAHFIVANGEAANDPRLNLAVSIVDLADEVIEWVQPEGPNPVAKPAPPGPVAQ